MNAPETISSHLHPTPSWEPDFHPRPHGREEVWRFTPIERFAPLFDSEGVSARWTSELPANVTSQIIDIDKAREISWDAPVDLVATNAVYAGDKSAQLITVPAETIVDEPITIFLDADEQTRFGHLIVQIGHHARATVVLRHSGSGSLASKVEFTVDESAQLDLLSLQDWQVGAVHGSQLSIKVGRDAHVRTVQASIGQGTVRIVERAEYDGPGGVLEQLGIYFAQSDQHVEHRLFVDHNAPHTESHVDYRGALQGKGAHSVWIGDVLIRSVAEDIETYESNKNLVLTEGCRADSVPNLEIETGEIRGAGHSSSTGRFDEEQLFYLRSRGIPEDKARRLIVEGFFLDIIGRIRLPEIEKRLVKALDDQLASIEGVAHESLLSAEEN